MIPVAPDHPLASGVLLALDPGLRYPAAAIFERGVLVKASRIKIPGKLAKMETGERIRDIAILVTKWASEEVEDDFMKITHYAWERPEIYKKKRGVIRLADPNDLIPLAALGGAVGSYLTARTTIFAPTPREWSCGTSKSKKSDEVLTSSRGTRLKVRLSPTELDRMELTHDAADATAIGLYVLGRWSPLKSFSRS